MNFKPSLLFLTILVLLNTTALPQTSTLRPASGQQEQPLPQVEMSMGKKKSGKKKDAQNVANEAAQPAEGAAENGKGKKRKPAYNGTAAPVVAIRALLDAQVVAWNAGKLEEFMQGYWNSPELTFVSGGRKLMGYDATLERYRRTYQSDGKEMGKLTFGDLEIMPLGKDAAFVRGQYQLIMSDARELGGRFTLILRQFAGEWKIVHDHTSANQ